MTLHGSLLLDLRGNLDVVSFEVRWPGGQPQNPFALQRKENLMSFIQWDINFFTGLPEVDRQHNKLVALTNRLSEVPADTPEALDLAFAELRDYIAEHFSLEERLMEEAGIDAEHFAYHKQAHALFVARVAELWEARNRGEGKSLQEMLDFLKTWILQHILQTDRKMAREIHARLGTDAPHNMFTHY